MPWSPLCARSWSWRPAGWAWAPAMQDVAATRTAQRFRRHIVHLHTLRLGDKADVSNRVRGMWNRTMAVLVRGRPPELALGDATAKVARRRFGSREFRAGHPSQEVQRSHPQECGREPHHQCNVKRK